MVERPRPGPGEGDEVAPEERGERRRIEIVHESLLTEWPRLVRWRTQDEEGAQLRDELRQAARLWEQHDRSEDFLWSGTGFREYQLWRERYPGGLSEAEEEFGQAMTAHAERRRRRRRLAISVVLLLALVVAAVTGGLWLRSEAEARRAEAAKLLALAQLRLETDPTEALAYTTASLELADTEESRVFVMKTLGSGPPALVLDPDRGDAMVAQNFSPDGRWLSLPAMGREYVLVWHRDGSGPVVLGGHAPSSAGPVQAVWISDHELITGHNTEGRARIWSFPGGRLVREVDFGARAWWWVGETHLLAEVVDTDAVSDPVTRRMLGGLDRLLHLRSWKLPDGEAVDLGRVDWTALGVASGGSLFDPSGRGWIYIKGNEVLYRPLPVREGVRDRLVGTHENEAVFASGLGRYGGKVPGGTDRLWTRDVATRELRLWSLSALDAEPLRVVAPPAGAEEGSPIRPGLGGRWLVDDVGNSRHGQARLWDLEHLPAAEPRLLKRSGSWFASTVDFHPDGDWIVAATNHATELSFWPLAAQTPIVVRGYDAVSGRRPVVFTPDGEWLVTYWWGGDKVRLWPLPRSGRRQIRELEIEPLGALSGLSIDPAGKQLFVAGYGKDLSVVPLDGGEPRRLEGFQATTFLEHGVFSPSGRLAAAATFASSEEFKLRVWNLETGEVEAFELPPRLNTKSSASAVLSLAFVEESTLWTAGGSGVVRWDLDSGTYEQIVAVEPDQDAALWLSEDRQQLVTRVWFEGGECGPLVLHDLQTGQSRELETFLDCGRSRQAGVTGVQLAFDPALSVLAIGGADGILRVGRLEGSAPHLLMGHEGPIMGLAISPDGRWIASAGEDATLRLWPMPDLDEPPLHTLPRDELIAKLESLTNTRVVRDPDSPGGWKVELDPFPGWAEVPEW